MIKLFSEINVLSETKVKQKLETNMLDKLLRKIAFLKTNYSEKFVKCTSSRRSQMIFIIAVLKNVAIFTGKHPCWSLFPTKLHP